MKTRTLLLVFALLLITCLIYAQKLVNGTVSDPNGDPLIGVSILVKGTNLGTATDVDGRFSLNVPETSSAIEFSYLGYRTQVISNLESPILVIMQEDLNQIDEVVITGLGTSVKRKNSANSVASISSNELTGVTPQSTVESSLYGKFKGAEIKSNSGAPGGGMAFKLRGTTSISGSSQPLIVLDGIIIDNSSIKPGLSIVSASQAGGSTRNQDNPSNRLADIDPNDIETIEILKGASAAAIYGSRAGGGVVIITTKRGAEGKTNINFHQSIGQNSMLNPLGVREWTEEKVLASAYAGDIDLFKAAKANGTLHNYEDELYGNKGMLFNTRLSFSGGNNKTRFYVGGSFKDEEGIVNNTGYNKISARVNVDHQISKLFDIAVSSNYISSSSDRGFFNNDNSGTTMGISFLSTPSWAQLQANETGTFPANPYAPSNFLETAALITNNESVNRFIGGGTLTAKLVQTDQSSLKAVFRGGLDFYNLNTTAIFPNSLQFQRDGNGLNGVSLQGSTINKNTNIALFLVHNYYLTNGISFNTSAGITQADFDQNTIFGEASNLIGSQTNLDQAGNRNVTQNRQIQQDKGFFVQEEINFRDQIIATVGVRGDKSSNNGDVNKLYYYPKANVAINLQNFDFWNSNSKLTQFKLRAAYGESGNFANFGAKYTTLVSTIVNGQAGVLVPTRLGNSSVGPERQKETEFGLDLELMNRMALDATYYIKNVEGLLLNADVPTSSGFSNQVTNAAELQNKGVEIGLNVIVVNNSDLQWNARFGWWKNTAEVTDMSVPAFTTGGFADFLGNYLIKEGYSPTTLIGVGPDPDIALNEGDDKTLQVWGNSEADFQLTWSNSLQYKNLDFSMVWHLKQGGDNINLSSLLFDLSETTHDFDDFTLDPSGSMSNGNFRLAELGNTTEWWIEDASYIRLREVGLYYTLPENLFGEAGTVKLGFSGSNLINIFDYASYDPEVSNFGSTEISNAVEVTPFPSSKRFDFHLIANF